MIGRARLALMMLALVVAGAGCEYFRDTPEQELARRHWRGCASELRDVKLDRVDTDGRLHFTYVSLNERNRVVECLAAAGQDRPPFPDPVATAQPGR